jgi:hypothetical protein
MRAGRCAFTLFGAVLVSLVLFPAAVSAQGVGIETRVPQRGIDIVPPSTDPMTRPSDAEFYRDAPRVQHDPAFVEPFVSEREGGRAGVSGWTAPQTPVGPSVIGQRDVPGWLAAGFTITWGGPPSRRAVVPR